jgi:MinD superfamily P-loop ATPase
MRHAYKQLAVVSGKGGTGKTSIVGSFAALARSEARRIAIADCDVDAANLHLLMQPTIRERHDFPGAKVARRDPDKCRQAGECEARCRFDAITTTSISENACEGCGVCVLVCPNNALTLETVVSGEYYDSSSRYGPMAHARLHPAAESSGKLVTVVRTEAENLAAESGAALILIDGPPGIGCTAIASVTGTDAVLIVTEPTLTAIHDMERVAQLTRHFGIPAFVLTNKSDLNAANAALIREKCSEWRFPLIGEVPFDDAVPKAIVNLTPPVEYNSGPAAKAIRDAWERLTEALA